MLLKVEGFNAGYPDVPVVADVDLTVAAGEIVALFGHNGAGKSTLLKALFGALARRSGHVWFKDQAVERWSTRDLTRSGMALVPQEQGVFPSLTVGEILRMGFWAAGVRGSQAKAEQQRRLERTFHYLPVLRERWSERAGNLSGGQQQMVSIGRALLTGPSLLMLDEPSTGLAPNLVEDIMRLVSRLREEEGLSVLLVEQNVGQALAVADRIYLMKEGRLIREARPDELTDSRELWSLF